MGRVEIKGNNMIYFTNKKTNEVFAYESDDEAKKYNKDFKNLIQMSFELFSSFQKNKPSGGEWTANGWFVDDDLLKQEQTEIINQKQSTKENLLIAAETEISRLERAIRLNMAKDGDKEKLTEWEIYSVNLAQLEITVDTAFPDKPE